MSTPSGRVSGPTTSGLSGQTSSEALNPALWDGLPSPSSTFGGLVRRGVVRGGQGMRRLFAHLGVLASQRAWLAWACGVGVFALAGLILATLGWTITALVWPTLGWMASGLDPNGHLPGWGRGLLGLGLVVVAAVLIRLAVSLFIDYPARFWVALSWLARTDEGVPPAQRAHAVAWLKGPAIVRGVVALALLGALIAVLAHGRDLLDGVRDLTDQIPRTVTTPEPPAPVSLPLSIESTIRQVENGQATFFDTDLLRSTSVGAINPKGNLWQALKPEEQSEVLKNPDVLAMWAFLPALDAHVSHLLQTAESQRMNALARGQSGEANGVVNEARTRLARLNDALWVLTEKQFAAVTIGASMYQQQEWAFSLLLDLSVDPATGLRLPDSYGCAVTMDVPRPYAPEHLSATAQQARANVLQRYRSLSTAGQACTSTARGWSTFSRLAR